MIRILLADDHEVVRRGLRQLLEVHDGWQICGETGNGRSAIDLAARLQPDVAILDHIMPELNGIEAARQIRHQNPRTEVLIYTMHASQQHIREVLAAGARGYVLKSDSVRHIEFAVEALARHQPYIAPGVVGAVWDEGQREQHDGAELSGDELAVLTPREREIFQLLANGRGNKEIAGALSISVKTVETHRASLMKKLHLESLPELTRFAIRHGVIAP